MKEICINVDLIGSILCYKFHVTLFVGIKDASDVFQLRDILWEYFIEIHHVENQNLER
jgi:hypothetical protein